MRGNVILFYTLPVTAPFVTNGGDTTFEQRAERSELLLTKGLDQAPVQANLDQHFCSIVLIVRPPFPLANNLHCALELRRGVISPIAAAAVNKWIETADIGRDRSSPLFRPSNSPRGGGVDGFKRRRMTIRAIQLLVKKYCLEVGIDEQVSVHSLRVTAATEADRAGIPLIDIQHWLGHKDPRTTLRYIRGTENLDRSPAYNIRYG